MSLKRRWRRVLVRVRGDFNGRFMFRYGIDTRVVGAWNGRVTLVEIQSG